MTILGVLRDGRRLNLAELTEATGLPRATAHRLAHALQAHGLTALGTDDRWSLGPRVGELAGRAPSLDEAAGPALAALRDATGESVQLFVPRAGARVCTASLESPHSLRTIVPVGAELPMDRGSAAAVLNGSADVARRGWAQSVEEREEGVASV